MRESREPDAALGDFRHEGKGDDLRVTVRLKAFRGKEELAQREAELRPGEAPAFLRKSAGDLVSAGAAVSQKKRPDPHQEAQRLTERAAEFQRLGQWEESLALIEAALLLEPSQERHYRAAAACSRLSLAYGFYAGWALENKKLGRQYYLRGLDHLEEFFRTAGTISRDDQRTYDFIGGYPVVEFGLYLKDPSQPDAVAAVAKEREILLRILRRRVRGGYDDEGWIMKALDRDRDRKDYFAVLYKLLAEFQGLPSFHRFVDLYTRFDSWKYRGPGADEFITKLEQSGNAELRERGKYLRARKQADKPESWGAPVDPFLSAIPDSQAAHFRPIRFPLAVEVGTLATGDYSVKGLENVVAIERKSLSDLLGCIGGERERFDREVMRLLAYPCRAIIVEATWGDLEAGEWRSKVTSSAAIGSCLGWIAQGVPIVMAGDHERAGRYVSRLLFTAARRRWRELRQLASTIMEDRE